MHIGIDIGGTKIDVVLTDADGTVADRERVATVTGAAGVTASTTAAVEALCARTRVPVDQADSVGVGIPGAITDGVVRHALNLGIDRFDLASALHEAWGVRPVVDNDVSVAALGAWTLAGRVHQSIAYLNLGTGLAAGLILDGRLWRGARGAAGEIGHVSIDPAGPTDADGLPGGLETYAAGSGIVRQYGGNAVSAMEVLAQAGRDDEATAIMERLHFGVATAVRMLVLTVDVEHVVIGGGLAGLGEPLLAGARRHFQEWAQRSDFLASVEFDQRVSLVDATLPVAAIGAAMSGAGRG